MPFLCRIHLASFCWIASSGSSLLFLIIKRFMMVIIIIYSFTIRFFFFCFLLHLSSGVCPPLSVTRVPQISPPHIHTRVQYTHPLLPCIFFPPSRPLLERIWRMRECLFQLCLRACVLVHPTSETSATTHQGPPARGHARVLSLSFFTPFQTVSMIFKGKKTEVSIALLLYFFFHALCPFFIFHS